jgi:nucleotide-binding universal stress UspA family protein
MRLWNRKGAERRPGQPRLLVPFADRQLDPEVLDAALRIARAEGSVLVPAYLLVVPLEFSLDAPVHHAELSRAMPLLEAVELAARRARVPVDARIELGRSPIDALSRLWDVESFDRVVIPAPAPGRKGFSSKDLTWMLGNGPGEILILRPASEANGEALDGRAESGVPATAGAPVSDH